MPGKTDAAAVGVMEFLKGFALGTFTMDEVLRLVILFVICVVSMKILLVFLDKAIVRLKVERGLHTFIKSLARVLCWFIIILIMADALGVNITSLVALFSVIGLAISLAIQGTLSNLAGGIMILVSKPFKTGDYIEAAGMGGTVTDIGLVYTRMATIDNKMVFIPNSEISSAKIVNYTTQEQRRVDLSFFVSEAAPFALVEETMLDVVHHHGKTLFTPEPIARVNAYKDGATEYIVRVWCATVDYWEVYFDLLEQIKEAFDRTGILLTYHHVDVHIVEEKGGAS